MTNRELLIDFLGWYQRNTQEEGTENEKWMDEQTVDSYLNQPNGSNMVLAVSSPEAYRSMVESIIVPQGYKTIHIGHAAQVSAAQFLYKKQVDQLITELHQSKQTGTNTLVAQSLHPTDEFKVEWPCLNCKKYTSDSNWLGNCSRECLSQWLDNKKKQPQEFQVKEGAPTFEDWIKEK